MSLLAFKIWHGYLYPTYQGTSGNDWFAAHSSDADGTVDVVNGNGGYDYFSLGGGDDKIAVHSNDGTWRGSGNEYGNATIIYAGSGNDQVSINGYKGAFEVYTGEGRDTVNVNGGDYVKINAADNDFERDVFNFSNDFHGIAEIYGVDRSDFIDMGSNMQWRETSINGDLAFYNTSGGGIVHVMGVDAYGVNWSTV